jgi:hypothetical protein
MKKTKIKLQRKDSSVCEDIEPESWGLDTLLMLLGTLVVILIIDKWGGGGGSSAGSGGDAAASGITPGM